MATSARTWFYSVPEPRPYYIEERVNHTLWKNRLQGVYMTCTQATAPIKMEGSLNGMPLFFEWEPGKYFILRLGEERKEIIGVMRQILLGFVPSFAYQDLNGLYVVEWHTDDDEARWKDLQGNPQYQGLRRLKKK
ncbi:MAG: hypothetical protein MUE40_06975 [Anaerolineae bacterium]|jgi:hypothetical protein|nr:hypothetical protein [Anaerolineae bacterium]